LREF
jgi:hypothetical protein